LEIKVDPFQPPHYSNSPPWQDMGAACPRPPSNCLSWYASQTESDGPRTSDLSPVSGYFDWSHSSNNTSPIQYDESVLQPSPGAAPHTSRMIQPERQSPFITNYPVLRRPSHQDAPSTLSSQDCQSLIADYPEPGRLVVTAEQDVNTVLPSPTSPSPKHETWSEPSARDVAEHEDSATSRSGKRWKAAHRAVERRYRSNLNLKIIKLGQCLPTLRDQAVALEDLENGEDCRPAPKAKLQKGHVLSKAVDYIQSLQQHVSELEAENRQLEGRVQALHMLVEEGCQPSPELSECRPSPEVPRGSFEQTSPGRRPKQRFSTATTDVTVETEPSLPEEQIRMSSSQNEFSFVSENPSLALKRPRVTRGGVARMLST
jgi:Helix-loop-helix DNA-binding domain